MKIVIFALLWLVSGALVVAAAVFGKAITFQQQWPLFEALRATAAIIFAVVGAWLAIVYPERLKLSLGVATKGEAPVPDRFSSLFTPIAHSTMILGLVLLTGILAPIAKQIPWFLSNIAFTRSVSFVLLVVLTLWQIWTVVLTLVPADMAKSRADEDIAHAASMSALNGLASTAERPAVKDDD
jgi:hypothetical protein